MRVNFRFKIANFTIFVMLSKTQTLEGVTSLQKDRRRHIIMWDLEKSNLKEIEKTLKNVQRKFHLSHIYVTSDIEGSYRAWCYSRVDFVTFLKILLDSIEILDWNFFYWTVKRGKATLRTSNKKNRIPQRVVSVLLSYPMPIPTSCERVVYDTGLTKRGFTVLLGV
jgi:hypothetical protein